jgi:DNA gyrase subunit A
MSDGPSDPMGPGEAPAPVEGAENHELATPASRRTGTEPIDLQVEIQRSYLDYAMSVIVGRALPDVRDGLKPVHRRVLYAMYDGGYRPDRGWNKCSRVVGEVMGLYHPHGDSAIYDTLVRLAQPWVMRAPLVTGQGNFGSPGNDSAAAMRYTECKMAPLAMEMVRDIDEDTVDFRPNYDNREQEPIVLPARFPNLLVNGSTGIAVGMATNIPTHNLREVASAVQWSLDNPEATQPELLEAAMARVKGPDFPTGGLIVGRKGIEDAYRTGRGSVIMRAVINIEEDNRGRTLLVVTELPYMCNPDNLAMKIADLVNAGKLTGIADIRDDTSARTGQRLVFVLKRDAQPRVVMNNLYKHTGLQDSFGCNMLALVDDVPRTLRLDQFISYWISHQVEVIVRRTRFRLRRAQEQAHILRGLVKALDMLDEVITLIRGSQDAEAARTGLMALLDIDEVQATYILDTQLRRLAAMERQKTIDRLADLQRQIEDLEDVLAKPERQREIISLRARGDRREVRRRPAHQDHRGRRRPERRGLHRRRGRGRHDHARRVREAHQGRPVPDPASWRPRCPWRVAPRGRRGRAPVRDHVAPLDPVLHDEGSRVPDQGVAAPRRQPRRQGRSRGWPAELPAGRADRAGAGDQVVRGRVVPPVGHPQRPGEEDPAHGVRHAAPGGRHRGQLPRGDDELIGAQLCNADDDVLLVSRKGQAIRFAASDDQLRPMGRATSGVTGMKFRNDDALLSMTVIDADMPEDDRFVFTVTDGGFAKRTAVSEYREQNRGGLGIKAMKLNEDRGSLVGGLVVSEGDEVIAMKTSGQITRSKVTEVPVKGRDTMGVKFVLVKGDDSVAAIARYPESDVAEVEGEVVDDGAESRARVAGGRRVGDESRPTRPHPEDTDTE